MTLCSATMYDTGREKIAAELTLIEKIIAEATEINLKLKRELEYHCVNSASSSTIYDTGGKKIAAETTELKEMIVQAEKAIQKIESEMKIDRQFKEVYESLWSLSIMRGELKNTIRRVKRGLPDTGRQKNAAEPTLMQKIVAEVLHDLKTTTPEPTNNFTGLCHYPGSRALVYAKRYEYGLKKIAAEPAELKKTIVQALHDLKNTNHELKSELKDLYIHSAGKVYIKSWEYAVVIKYSYRSRNPFRKIDPLVARQLETKFSESDVKVVIFIPNKTSGRSLNKGKEAKNSRFRRIFSSVHDDIILESMLHPAQIVGKRIKFGDEGTITTCILLDPKIEIHTKETVKRLSNIYFALTQKIVDIEYAEA